MTETLKAQSTRDALRAKVFSSENTRFKREKLNFKGSELELQQPNLEQVAELWAQPNGTTRAIFALVKLGFIPGTDERLFEDEDFDNLIAMPYGPEMTRLHEILGNFLTGDIKEAEKNSVATPTSTTSTP